MKAIRDYFSSLGRNPTDIEIETLAQTWSEHCKHTIFSSPIDDDVKEGLYKHYIKRATNEINSPICVSTFEDNAGAIIFDDDFVIADKVETHNSPSALDPFSGSITGILGVNRDIIGFGRGAQPILNTYYFCFAEHMTEDLYRDKNLKHKILDPSLIMEGVIKGVNVGGNCSGIPTVLGSLYFNNKFCAKPLVFVGTSGIIPKSINNYPSHLKEAMNGDYIVIIGGRVGKDGIHGATFSSSTLQGISHNTVVQIGDPITQKKLSDAIVKESRDLNLYNSITDNGAGGLSSSVGEMGKRGFKVYLEKVPLKYKGMLPWEIWISESQERMTLSVSPNKYCALKEIMEKHDVEISIIGEFNDTQKAIVTYYNETIMEIDTDFLHNGKPIVPLKTKKVIFEPQIVKTYSSRSLEEELNDMFSRPNISSKEFIVTQYDHEVQGSSVIKPLQGKGRVCSDSIVIKPIFSSQKGVVKSQGFGSIYGEMDTYHMAACAIDTAIRNYIAVGGNFNHLALIDNFCWPNSHNPERLWQLKQCAKGCYDYAKAFNTPFISGKDSMFNNFCGYNKYGEKVTIDSPPSLLISTVGIIDNIDYSISLDAKRPGDLIYILGLTRDELAMSEYQLYSNFQNNRLPTVNTINAKILYQRHNEATRRQMLSSSIALNLGGLAVTLSKSLIGGQLGAEIDLSLLPIELSNNHFRERSILFSESQSRILVTIPHENKEDFESLFKDIVHSNIGKVTECKLLKIKNVANINLEILEKSYKKFSQTMMQKWSQI